MNWIKHITTPFLKPFHYFIIRKEMNKNRQFLDENPDVEYWNCMDAIAKMKKERGEKDESRTRGNILGERKEDL